MVIDNNKSGFFTPTFQDVLTNFTKKEIFEYYLEDKITFGKTIKSPLREDDNNPSFVINRSTLKGEEDPWFVDHGTGITGDVITFLQIKKGLSYTGVIKMIVDELGLSKGSLPNMKLTVVPRPKLVQTVTASEIKLVPEKQNFLKRDIDYWKSQGITQRTLVFYNVISCKTVTLVKGKESSIVRTYSRKNPVYAYEINKGKYKIYCPLAKKDNKWLQTTTIKDIQGMSQLPIFGDLLIITKSLKDVMFLHELGYSSISLNCETSHLNGVLYEELFRRFEKIVCFYDNDNAGLNGMADLFKAYGIPNMVIPVDIDDGKPNSKPPKDITEFYMKYGLLESKKFVEDSLEELDESGAYSDLLDPRINKQLIQG